MTETAVIERPNTQALATESRSQLDVAQRMTVDSPESYDLAAVIKRELQTLRKRIADTFDPIIAKWHEGHKSTIAAKRELDTPPAKAMKIIEDKRLTWQAEEERKRRAEEDRLRAIEMKRAEDAKLAEATRLEAEGRKDQAEAVLEAPIVATPVVLRSTVPKSDGVSVRTTWAFRIVEAALIPREWLIPDQAALGAHARSRGESAIGTIAGVEFYPVKSEATSAYK